MKRLLQILLILAAIVVVPSVALATNSVPWSIVNLTDGFISPNVVNGSAKGILVSASSTINGNFSVSTLTSGNCVQASTGGLLTTTGTACGTGSGGSPFPFTPFPNYNATSTPIGFLQGIFSTASTTFNANVFFSNLSAGLAAIGTNGLHYSTPTTTASCSGGSTCTSFTIIGSSPITITGTTGTVTAVSVASANGFAGSSSGGATPSLTLTTSISGVLKGNGTAIGAASNGTDYTLITANTCGANQFFNQATAGGVFTCSTPSGGTGSGLATSSPISAGNVLEYSAVGAGSAFGIATSSVSSGTGISLSGTAGALVGGTSLTINNTGVISNSCPGGFLTCSGTNPSSFSLGTLGVANGGTNATSFTTTGNDVYWNGTSLLTAPLTSAVTIPYASTTVASAANIFDSALVSGNCVQASTNGLLTTTGSACGSGGGASFAYPFTPSTDGGINTSATSTALEDTASGLAMDVSQFGWYGQAGKLLAYASSTNATLVVGNGAGNNAATTSATVAKNTAIGVLAMSSAGTPNNITAIGYNALAKVTGNFNTAIGASAATGLTSATDATIIGYQAVAAGALTGADDTVIGMDAGQSMSGSQANDTILGSQTATGMTSGNANTYLGAFSANNMGPTGSNNTGIGYESLFGITSGAANTTVGYLAGGGISTGKDNIFIGAATSTGSASLTTGNQNIIIGDNLIAPVITGNGQLDIGNLIFGTGLGATQTNVSKGNIGIGTTTPYAELSVMTGMNFLSAPITTVFAVASSSAGNATTSLMTVLSTGQIFAPKLTLTSAAQADTVCYSSSGELIADSLVCSSSARRYKYDINNQSTLDDLNQILALEPVSYYFKPDFNGALQSDPNYSRLQIGLIADDVIKINPAFGKVEVGTSTFEGQTYGPGTPDGVDYDSISAALVGAVKEQQKEIDALQPMAKTVEDDWQWIVIGLLVCWNIALTVRRKK